MPVRPYAYEQVGFFEDATLSTKVSSLVEVEGDSEHEKVRVQPGDVVFAAGADGAVYEIQVLEKPSLARVALQVTRVR